MRLDVNTVLTWLGLVFSVASWGAVWYLYSTFTRHSAPAQLQRLLREGREVTTEVADTLEKLNTMALRLARREQRAAKATEPRLEESLDDRQLTAGAPADVAPAAPFDRQAWKAAVRQRNGWVGRA